MSQKRNERKNVSVVNRLLAITRRLWWRPLYTVNTITDAECYGQMFLEFHQVTEKLRVKNYGV